MRHTSKLGVGTALLVGWILIASVDGQQPLGSQPPPIKKGHLVTAGAKEYDLLSEAGEVEGKFRSFDPDTSIVKFSVEYPHAEKGKEEEFDRQQKDYREKLRHLQERYNNLQGEFRQAMASRTPQEKNNRLNNFNSQMQNWKSEKQTADQQYHEAIGKLGMVRDDVVYELLVAKDAPVRKMWAPKLYDDKGKVRGMTTEERPKYKGLNSQQVGWTTKLEIFEKGTHIKVKLKLAAMKEAEPEAEPTNSQTPPPTTTTPPLAPNPAVPGKDDPANKRQEVKLEDRPVVKMVIAEADPNAGAGSREAAHDEKVLTLPIGRPVGGGRLPSQARMATPEFLRVRRHLGRRDKVLRDVIRAVGPCTLVVNTDHFSVLARSIVSQQISTKAARAIADRLIASLGRSGLKPKAILSLSDETMRAAGLSTNKQRSLRDLADKCMSGEVPLKKLSAMEDEAVIETLIPVRGIGRWTAEMFLIFSLGRLDVFPVADYGLKAAVKRHYGHADLPTKDELDAVGVSWQPFRSVGTWYMWRGLALPESKGMKDEG